MKQIFLVFLVLLGINLLSTYASASIDIFEFASEENRERYLALTKELRCPKCQNQDIADSNAPIAEDMRRETHRLVEQGESHDDIVKYMVERFGEFVTYKPKVIPETYVLWFAPWVLLFLGVVIVVTMTKKRRIKAEVQASALVSFRSELSGDGC